MANSHILSIILQVVDRATPQLRATQNQIDRMSRTISDFGKTSRVMDFTKRLNTVGLTMDSVGRIIDINTKQFISMGSAVERVGKLGSESFGGMNKAMLGIGLGMTFFMWGVSMQINRLMRSMFNTFTLAEGETGALNQQFNIVRANLAAISIAFFDAFAQSGLFEIIINVISRLADWFLDLTDAQRKTWVEGAVKVYAFMKAISFLGQVVLGIYVAIQLVQSAAFPFLIIAAGLTYLWWQGWKSIDLILIAVGLGILALSVKLIKTGIIMAGVGGVWFLILATGLIVLALLHNKFGTFGNAMKVWVSGIVLAIAGLFDIVFGWIMDLINLAIRGMIRLANYARIVTKGKVNIDTSALEELKSMTSGGFIGLTATLLNKIGFNPATIETKPRTIQDILGEANTEVKSVQEDTMKTQQEFSDRLGKQVNLQQETLYEQQRQTSYLASMDKTQKENQSLFERGVKGEEGFIAPIGG